MSNKVNRFPNNPTKKVSSDEINQNYIVEKDIGEGTFGKVRLATHVLTNEKVTYNALNIKFNIGCN